LIIFQVLIETSLGCARTKESTIDRKIAKNAFRIILSVGILSDLVSLLLFLAEREPEGEALLVFLLDVFLRFFEPLVSEEVTFFLLH